MIRLLAFLLRRRRTVLVDADAYQHMAEMAVIGAAIEIIEAESERWHDLR